MKKEILLLSFSVAAFSSAQSFAQQKPNIIFILADDMGYGDVAALNENSKIKTPNLDNMVRSGLSFSDAHTSSSVSTPSRYGILTGRYNWRSTLKWTVVSGYSRHLISPERTTVASLLKRANYTTGCIGKWHLGWDWDYIEEPTKIDELEATNKGVLNYSTPIKNGPADIGFDYFYGFSGSLDMPPYVYVENDRVTALPDHETESLDTYAKWRNGPTSPDFVHDKVMPHLTDKAIEFIEKEGKDDNPFFLYLPYPSPHTPILPTEAWKGKSGLNPYGDFVMFVDYEVGRIINSLKEMGIEDNTLIVFTTDNGCSPAAKIDELEAEGHYPNYIFRGAKADLFEGGHRVPCIVQWKDGIDAGATTDQTICLTDFFATFAEIADIKVGDAEGEDSFSVAKLFKDSDYGEPIREATIHHSINGEFAIRSGDWKLLASASSGGWSVPTPGNKEALAKLPPMQLYNLKDDPSEQKNLYNEEPEKVEQLLNILRKQISDGRSTKGPQLSNEVRGRWRQIEPIFNN